VDKATNQLALDMAAKLQPPAQILAKHGLTEQQFVLLSQSPEFKRLFKEAKSFWESDKNAVERVRTKCSMLVEDSLLEIYSMVHDPEMAAAARLDSFRTLAKMAGVSGDAKEGVMGAGQQFSITINLDKERPLVIDGDMVDGSAE
jgi:hypothetical protein